MKQIKKRILSLLLCVALLAGFMPAVNATAATPLAKADIATTVTDPGTADSWEGMMGTSVDGNRYAGRVWVDKSVYKDGDTAVLNSKGTADSSFKVELEEDEAFQVVFSALGSSMTTTTTTSKTGPMDVVLILDNSVSMNTTSGGTTRMQKVIVAANTMLKELLADNKDVRLGVVAYAQNASTVLPFGKYDNGVVLRVNNYTGTGSRNGIISAYTTAGQRINSNYQSAGYANYTNTQAGFTMGMDMLAKATATQNRKPVVILLTDGAANTALDTLFDEDRNGTVRQVYHSSNIDPMIALSTLLRSAYNKALVKTKYGKSAMVYGVGVDLSATDGSNAIINPKDNFNANNRNGNIVTAYNTYINTWSKGQDVSRRSGGYNFAFRHEYPDAGIRDADVIANINYVDTYYPVTGADVSDVFDQIYQELSSGVFNPISSSTTVSGATGVQDTPLIYVDFIGEYMEVKQIQSISVFGQSYDVVDNGDGTYSVQTGLGKNPTTGEDYDTSKDVVIAVTEQADGTQKLQIEINQQILPILLEKVDDRNINDQHTATIIEIGQTPLRVYYTIGLDSDILLPNGAVDVTKIDVSYRDNVTGNQISFYSNRFGVENTNGNGDAHVGFKPSLANRYYYYQTNHDIFASITRKDGQSITRQENEYGFLYEEDTYNLTWLTYEKYKTLQDGDEVFTYVTYYRPTPSSSDAANAAEEVTYLVYADWAHLKESVAFYDYKADTYVNYDATSGYVTGEAGYAVPLDKVEATVNAYVANNPNAEIYAMLGVESLRTSRLHNMTVEKGANNNPTGTVGNRYAPEYTHETADKHHGNDVVVWLGNNGKLTVEIDTGIALTKTVTEPIGNANDTYALTVTVPNGVNANPVAVDAAGNPVASTYSGNVLTVQLKADQTAYITGIPAGTTCTIGETIPAGKDYYVSSKTDTVTVPTLTEVLSGAKQFAAATVTNTPNKYGDLTIVKDVAHNLTNAPAAMQNKEFTFQVKLNPVPVKKTYQVDKDSASLITGNQITVADDGTFTVKLKDNESVTILGLPEGTSYTVTETQVPAGYTNSTGTVTGTIVAGGDQDAHFINTYTATPIKPQITVTGTKTLNDPNDTYIADENFTFVLSMYNGSGYDDLQTVTAKQGQSYTFRLQDYLTAGLGIGEYYFRITERAGNTPGMVYDATRGLFKVTVTDTDANGVLEFAVADAGNTTISGNTVTKNFVNTYNVERISVDINITKELENETGVNLPLNQFHFEQVNTGRPNGDAAIPNRIVTTDASGKATLRIADLGPGEYKFTLTEKAGTLAGMTYDTTARQITVTVTEDAGGVLHAVTKIDGVQTTNVTFENRYALTKTTHTIEGTKTLVGRDLANGQFSFALYETDASFELGANAAAKAVVTNTGNAFAFPEIEYTKVGTYYYSVKEIVPAEPLPGVTYDTTHYHITVTVSVNGGALKKTVAVNKIGHNDGAAGEIAFVNTYTAKATQYTISGTKVLTGRSQKAGEFRFALYDSEGAKLSEAVNKADGTFTFDAITFDRPGTYTYTVKELAGNAPGVTYDSAELRVTITVTDTNAVLSAAADQTQIRFENQYIPTPATARFTGTKTLTGGQLEKDMFTFFLYETDASFDIAGKTPVAVKNAADGSFAFDKLTYATAGTYFYAVVEDVAAPIEDVVYDRTVHKLMVQVSDAGDGKLRVVVTNLDTGNATAAAENAVVSVSFTNATFQQTAQKEVYLDQQTTVIDGQKVNPGDVLTYHITYTNYTGEPVVADIMDTIPANTTYVEGSASQGGNYAGGHINWILNVAKGETVSVSFQVKVEQEQTMVTNTAVVRDGVNTYQTNTVVNHTVKDVFEKEVLSGEGISIDGQKVQEGDELVYKLTFTNVSENAVSIKITDQIPANTTYVAASADQGGVYENGAIVWNISDIAPWSEVSVTFKVTVNADIGAVTIKNQATATDGTNNYETNWVSNYTEEDPDDQKPPKNDDPKDPQTGDSSKLQLWTALLMISGGGILALVFCGKKKRTVER